MDYGVPGAWDKLATRLRRRHVATPAHCRRVVCEPGWSWRPSLPDYDLWLVLAGRGRATLNDTELSLHAGTLLVLRPGDTGYFRHDPSDPLTVVFCHFDFVDPTGRDPVAVDPGWLPSRHVPTTNLSLLSGLVHRVVRLSRDPHPLRRLETEAVFQSALIEVYVQDAKAHGHPVPGIDPRLQDVIDFVRDEPRRRPTLHEAAAVAGLSASHLSRLFSQQLGTSFRRFVLETRLDRAHQLLSETTMTIAEVSLALGYRDVFLFSRQFRQRYGQPPSQVRQPAD